MTSLDNLTSSVNPTYTEQAASPFLSSYAGMSSNQLMQLASDQQSYNPQAPAANAQAASDLISQALTTAQDPNLQLAMLQKAYDLITPGGGVGAAPVASTAVAGQPVGGAPAASAPAPAASAPAASGTPDSSGLSVNGDSVNTGEYTIAASKSDDGSLTVTDNNTGKSFEVWGDPHIKENGQDLADFQKNGLNIQLQDGTTIHMQPGALQNGVAHLDQVSITKGNDAVTMGGVDGNFNQGVNTSGVMQGQAANQDALYNAPGATDLTYGADDMLHYNNSNGSMGAAVTAQANGGETNLDGVGGGLVGQPAAASTGSTAGTAGAPSSDMEALIQQLQQSVGQYVTGFQGSIISNMLAQMQNQSGFEDA